MKSSDSSFGFHRNPHFIDFNILHIEYRIVVESGLVLLARSEIDFANLFE